MDIPEKRPIFKKGDNCERCGKPLTHLSYDRVGALVMEMVRCENGHEYVRFRLAEVGD